MAIFHQNIPNRTKVISLLVRRPSVFDRSKTFNATKSKKTILLRQISNNCYQTHLILLRNLCSMCLPPVPTYFLNLFVKLLMALLMGSRGKSSHINSNATFNSLVVLDFGCKLWYFSSVAPHTLFHQVQIRRIWDINWFFSIKPGQLSEYCARRPLCAVAPFCWKMNPASWQQMLSNWN